MSLRPLRTVVQKTAWALLSVPLHFKVLGIGVLIAAIFGITTTWYLQAGLGGHLDDDSRARAIQVGEAMRAALATAGADHGERLRIINRIASQNGFEVKATGLYDTKSRLILGTPSTDPHIEQHFQLWAQHSDGNPSYLVSPAVDRYAFDVWLPQKSTGDLRWSWIRLSDETARGIMRSTINSFLLIVLGCFAIGQIISLSLVRILVNPLRTLIHATNGIAAGDFSIRVPIRSSDEVGTLSRSINEMSEALDRYQKQIDQREAERKQLLQRLVTAQEDEKRTLSRELHDHFGQVLSLHLMMIESLRSSVDAEKENVITEMERHTKNIIEDIRELSYSLRPSVLDDYGLDSAVERYVEQIRRHGSFKIDYTYLPHGDARLPGPVETASYRIIQEALTNVLRHSHCANASVVIHHLRHEVILIIEDDGDGFDRDTVLSETNTMGLLTMQERTALLGGTLTVESDKGKGTEVRARIPV